MYPKQSIVPPGGFHFNEHHNGAEIKLTGDSVENLAANIEKYRLTNGIPLGDPTKEVIDYICGNWPHFCNDNDRSTFNEGNRPDSTAGLATRVAHWMTRLWNIGAGNFVSDAEAKRRADICAGCAMHKDFRAGGCSSCVQGTDKLAFIWSTGKILQDLKLWHSLRACRATGAHLQASIFAKTQPDATEQETIQLSPQCWRR
jgi:hypothetical protein